ncbi:MAG: hypothetical protein RLZZ574_2161 [Cyanobacteriota bacterium]
MVKIEESRTEPTGNNQRERVNTRNRTVHEYAPQPLRRPSRRSQNIPIHDPNVRWQRVNNFFITQITDSYEAIQAIITEEEQLSIHDALRTVSNKIQEVTETAKLRMQ